MQAKRGHKRCGDQLLNYRLYQQQHRHCNCMLAGAPSQTVTFGTGSGHSAPSGGANQLLKLRPGDNSPDQGLHLPRPFAGQPLGPLLTRPDPAWCATPTPCSRRAIPSPTISPTSPTLRSRAFALTTTQSTCMRITGPEP